MDRPRALMLFGLRVLVLSLALLVVARAFVFTTYRVSGSSMRETLRHGDRILVCDTSWLSQPLENGDTVVLDVHGETLVKRIMATPGDRIAMRQGIVRRNGQDVAEDIPADLNRLDSFPEYRLGSDEYFVLGDHRRVSIDSREFGPVSGAQLLGRVLLRIHAGGLSTVAALERPAP